LLELKGLKDGLIVLILMLQNHVIDVPLTEQRIGLVRLSLLQPRQNSRADFFHYFAAFRKGRQPQPATLAPRMLEGIEETGHLDELDGTVEVPGQPELLEVSDVPEIPDDWAHERIVLQAELSVGQRLHQQERPGSSFRKPGCQGRPIYSPRHGECRHHISIELGGQQGPWISYV
jgi:hypothetical protein